MRVRTLSLILPLILLVGFAFMNNASATFVREERTPTTWSGTWALPQNVTVRDELTNEKVPSAWSGTWTNPGNVQVSDNNNASSSTNGAQEAYYNFNFGNLGLMVKVDSVLIGLHWNTVGDENVTIELSNDGGVSYSATNYKRPVPTLKILQWVDVSSAYSWTPSMLSNANFRVRLTYVQIGGTASEVRVDLLTVRVKAGGYASSSTNGASEVYGSFGFAPPTTMMRLGVFVGLEMYQEAGGDESIKVEVSNNGGVSYSPTSYTVTVPTTEAFQWVNASLAYSWTPSMLSNANFKVRITYVQNGGTASVVRVDLLSVKIIPVILITISPTTVPGKVGRNIQFDIYINEITEDVLDLYSWELKLNWTDIDFNYVSATEGPFLKQSGSTFWLNPIRGVSGGRETLTLSSARTLSGSGSRGNGVLATVKLYVVGAATGAAIDLYYIKLRESQNDPIYPPKQPEPKYDVMVIAQDATFALPRSYDIEPVYGDVDVIDLSSVAVNFGTNVARVTKIGTQWAQIGTVGWISPGFVGSSDDNRATASTNNAMHKWMYFMFNTTAWTAVSKVEVGLERMIDTGSRNVVLNMSGDNGATWGATTFTHSVADGFDAMVWVDVTTAFGGTWTKAQVNNIAVCVKLPTGSGTVRIDYMAIRVTPSPAPSPPAVFDSDADVNSDLTVDIDDLIMVATNYGEYDL